MPGAPAAGGSLLANLLGGNFAELLLSVKDGEIVGQSLTDNQPAGAANPLFLAQQGLSLDDFGQSAGDAVKNVDPRLLEALKDKDFLNGDEAILLTFQIQPQATVIAAAPQVNNDGDIQDDASKDFISMLAGARKIDLRAPEAPQTELPINETSQENAQDHKAVAALLALQNNPSANDAKAIEKLVENQPAPKKPVKVENIEEETGKTEGKPDTGGKEKSAAAQGFIKEISDKDQSDDKSGGNDNRDRLLGLSDFKISTGTNGAENKHDFERGLSHISGSQQPLTHKIELRAPGGFSGVSGSPAEQISFKIHSAVADGQDRISVKLEPAELGRVDIRLDFTPDGKTSISILAEKSDTLDMLKRDAKELAQSLLDIGVKAEAGNLSFNLKGGEGQNGNFQGFQEGGNSYRQALGQQAIQEKEETLLIGVSDYQGLDIKV